MAQWAMMLRCVALMAVVMAPVKADCTYKGCANGCLASFTAGPLQTAVGTFNCRSGENASRTEVDSCGTIDVAATTTPTICDVVPSVSETDEVSVSCKASGVCQFDYTFRRPFMNCNSTCEVLEPCKAHTCKQNETCKPTFPSAACTEEPCNQYTCVESCCSEAPTCPRGYDQVPNSESSKCSELDYSTEACKIVDRCCQRIVCRLRDGCDDLDCCPSNPALAMKLCRCPRAAAAGNCSNAKCGFGEYTGCRKSLEPEVSPADCYTNPCAKGETCIPQSTVCVMAPCPQYSCLAESVVKTIPDICALQPCGRQQQCTPSACAKGEKCPAYTCSPIVLNRPCCFALVTCREDEERSHLPCTLDEAVAGTCTLRSRCCQEAFCRKKVSDPCLGVACAAGEVCIPNSAEPSGHECLPGGSCCMAMPTCKAEEVQSADACSSEELQGGTCRRSAMCCKEIFCRTAACGASPCAADETCVPDSKVCVTTPCHQERCVSTQVAAQVDLCATRPCAGQQLCKHLPGTGPECQRAPEACCEAAPVCAEGESQSDQPCTVDAVAAGICRRSAMCCSEVFCRKENVCRSEACGGKTCVPVAINKGHACLASHALNDVCALGPCGVGQLCSKPKCTSQPCPAYVCSKPDLCCMALAACKPGTKGSRTPCTAEEVETGACYLTSMCCNSQYCRPDQAHNSSSDGLATWAIVLIIVGATVAVLLLAAGVFLACHSGHRPGGVTMADPLEMGKQSPSEVSTHPVGKFDN